MSWCFLCCCKKIPFHICVNVKFSFRVTFKFYLFTKKPVKVSKERLKGDAYREISISFFCHRRLCRCLVVTMVFNKHSFMTHVPFGVFFKVASCCVEICVYTIFMHQRVCLGSSCCW